MASYTTRRHEHNNVQEIIATLEDKAAELDEGMLLEKAVPFFLAHCIGHSA